jgi:hypothetical protein
MPVKSESKKSNKTQPASFVEAARSLECDESEERYERGAKEGCGSQAANK